MQGSKREAARSSRQQNCRRCVAQSRDRETDQDRCFLRSSSSWRARLVTRKEEKKQVSLSQLSSPLLYFCYSLQPSDRALATDDPIIVATKALIGRSGRAPSDVASLAQGIVHWQPPRAALEAAARGATEASSSSYGPAQGLPELVDALGRRLTQFNGLPEGAYEPMVTAGANQAFANVVLSCLDASDAAVLFAPYYFNHLMMLTGSGIPRENVLVGPRDPAMLPDLDWLEATLFPSEKEKRRSGENGKKKIPKLVVLVNPCNPTGVVLPRELLQRAADLTARAGSWLVVDNTYDHFLYGGAEHEMPREAPHVIHVSSFSKAYGMAGWRVGWLAAHRASGLGPSLLKVQDTVPICAPQLSQRVALAALEGEGAGAAWVAERVAGLRGNREAVRAALAPLDAFAAAEEEEEQEEGGGGGGGGGGSALGAARGAIYLWSRLPASLLRGGRGGGQQQQQQQLTDSSVVEWLVKRHGVCLVPGSACGSPGRVRAAFANLEPRECERAAARLARGVEELLEHAGKKGGGGGELPL